MGTKLNRIPTSEEMRRLRARWDQEDGDDIPLKDFDTTLTSGIEGTINQIGVFVARSNTAKSVEAENSKLDALRQLSADLARANEAIATLTTTMNHKASKASLRRFETEITAKHARSVDNLFKLVAVVGTVIGIIIAYKGHS
jgi:hypothetical protein